MGGVQEAKTDKNEGQGALFGQEKESGIVRCGAGAHDPIPR